MPATKQDLVVEQDATNVVVLTVIDGPSTLVGYEGRMDIRERKASTERLAQLDSTDIVVTDETRQVVVTIPSSATALYDWDEGYYDLYVVGPGGDRWRLAEGRARLSKTVTREDEA